jgi:LysR family glycine cleavage system transcriptional activator
MTPDLPTTPSLRAFSLVARWLSFKRAADQLNLSPSAVSRQIQALETHLGVRLLRRLNPGLELTDEGRRYLAEVDAALERLDLAQRRLTGAPRKVRVSALESFSESWLIPRLADFESAHPDIELVIEATLRHADFARDPVDVAIRFGRGPWDGLHSEPILDLDYFPVCSPDVARGVPPLRTPADLARHTLIHIAQIPDAWQDWLVAAGAGELQPQRAITYDHVGIALSAAASGRGIALSTPILCARWLSDGRLCQALPQRVRSEQTYHFVCRPDDLADRHITALRDWLVECLTRADAHDASTLAK